MRHTAASLKKMFDEGIPLTDNIEAYKQYEMLRDRLFSTAYRLMKDMPDNSHIDDMLKCLCAAQACGNLAITESFKEQ